MIFSKSFWLGALERSVKTIAQTIAAVIAVGTTGLFDVNWQSVLSIAGAAGLASLLTSIGSADFVAGPRNAIVVEVDQSR